MVATVEGPETLVSDYASIKSLISTYHPSGAIPIVSSEFGYPTTAVAPQTQGDYLVRSFLINLSQGIPISIGYDWKDDGKDTTNPEDNFGIVKTDYAPKPAYNEMQLLTKSLQGENLYQATERRTCERLAAGLYIPQRPTDPGGLDHEKRRAYCHRAGLGDASPHVHALLREPFHRSRVRARSCCLAGVDRRVSIRLAETETD